MNTYPNICQNLDAHKHAFRKGVRYILWITERADAHAAAPGIWGLGIGAWDLGFGVWHLGSEV